MKRHRVRLLCLMGIFLLLFNQWGNAKNRSGSSGFLSSDDQYWFPLGKGLSYRCYAVAVQNHNLFAGGEFVTAGEITANNIARWDGVSWSSMGTGTNGVVRSITADASSVYVGGEFTETSGNSTIKYIARWNGSNWFGLGIGVNGPVRAIAKNNGNVYAGGDFLTAGGKVANRIARWDGSSWSILDSGVNNTVRAIAIDGNNVYVGGFFTDASGVPANHIAKWNGSHWAALGDGLNGPVYSILIHENEIYVGGHFTEAGGNSAINLAKWDGMTWSEVGDGVPGDGADVNALAMCGGDLYVSGEFATVGGVSATNIAVWDGQDWSSLGTGVNLDVHSLALSNDFLYVGGAFWIAGGKQCSNVSRWRYTRSYAGYNRKITGPVVTNGGASVGVAWGDYNNDGYADLFIANTDGENNFLYTNNGNGTFTAVTTGPVVNSGGDSWAGSWGDYDNDGDLDLFVANHDGDNFLYQNNGNGTFTAVLTGDIVTDADPSQGCSWADYDNDGFIDLFVANGNDVNNCLYSNNGDGTFTKILTGDVVLDGGQSTSGTWADYNLDGKIDLFVTNLDGENNFLYKNNGNGTFTKVQAGSIVNDGGDSWSGSWGDYNGDTYPDLFVANDSGANYLYKNNGDNTFSRVNSSPLTSDIYSSRSSSWGDINNDGHLDLFLSNDDENGYVYINNGEGDFSKYYTESAVYRGAAMHDFDWDGDLDLCVATEGNNNYLFENTVGNANHWLNIRCAGVFSNTLAIGTKVTAKAMIDGEPVWQSRTVSAQTGFGGQNSLLAEFGFGDAMLVDYMRIEWPSGIVWDTTDVVTDQYLLITEREQNPVFEEVAAQYGLADNRQASGAMWFDYDNDGDLDLLVSGNNSTELNRLFRNDGNQFVDVAASVGFGPGNPSTLFHLSVGDYDNDDDPDILMYSGGYGLFRNDVEELGLFTDVGGYYPGGTFADYDNDGYLDIYVTQLNGENKLYRSQHDGTFSEVPGAAGLDDARYSRAAIWGDFDGDLDLDVYVVNGQSQRSSLYRNDISATGVFTDVTDVMGVGNANAGYGNGACWADYDNDGDLDLYLITLSQNRLYRNDINTLGTFTEVGHQLGVDGNSESTDARWADYDNDGDLDLYVINIGRNVLYRNNVPQGIGFLETTEMANQESFYSGGSWGDFDKDGDMDLYLATPGTNRLYRNRGNNYNWLQIEPIGAVSNRASIGARISLTVNGTNQVRYVETTSGFGSQNSLPVEFGLGPEAYVDMIQIEWPSGITWDTTNVAANQYLKILEPTEYPDGRGGIAGTVYRNDGSTVISGTRVEIRDMSNALIASVLTDAQGKYSVTDLTVGDYHVIANGFLYSSQTYEYFSEYYNNAQTPEEAAPVKVRNGLTSSDINFTLDKQIQVSVSVVPAAYPFKADGQSYNTAQIFTWRDNSVHSLSVEPYHDNAIGGRAYFDRWSSGAERVHDYTVPGENASLIAYFEDRYQFTVNSKYGTPSIESDWYTVDEILPLSIEENIIDHYTVSGQTDSIRHHFVSWEGTGNGSYTGENVSALISMEDNVVQTAVWKEQHPLTIIYDSSKGTVVVEPEGDWQDKNSVVKIRAIPAEEYLFDGWGGSIGGIVDTISFLMDTSKVIYPTFRLINKAPHLSIPDTSFAEDDSLTLPKSAWANWVVDTTNVFDDLQISVADTGDHLDLIWDTSGLTVWADANWNGTGWIVMKVQDPEGLTDTDTLFFAVQPVNDPPGPFNLISPDDGYQYSDEAASLVFTWSTSENLDAINGDLIRYIFYFGPNGGALDSIDVVEDTTFVYDEAGKFENGLYSWKVLAYDYDGASQWSSSQRDVEIAMPSDVNQVSAIPKKYELYQNYPNPFNPSTTIVYDLPKNSDVELIIYSITGYEVIRLVDENQKAGTYKVEWDGRNHLGRQVASGIYIYQIRAKQFKRTHKMMYVR